MHARAYVRVLVLTHVVSMRPFTSLPPKRMSVQLPSSSQMCGCVQGGRAISASAFGAAVGLWRNLSNRLFDLEANILTASSATQQQTTTVKKMRQEVRGTLQVFQCVCVWVWGCWCVCMLLFTHASKEGVHLCLVARTLIC